MTKAGTTWMGVLGLALCAGQGLLPAQTCATQAKMSVEMRSGLAAVSLTLAKAVQADDAARVQSLTIPQYADNQETFQPTALLIHSTASQVVQDNLEVTHVYALDAHARTAGQPGPAEFTCALTGTTSETDFSIDGLPPGVYAFSMVEATGNKPWLLAFLLRQDAGGWKMAGFYPRARSVAGHDGAWYWKTAYDDGKAGQRWPAWLLFGEADQLLRPANFVSSTKLDSLRSEQRSAAPPELANGLAPDVPLLVKSADGSEFRFTAIDPAGSDDGARLELMLHLKAESVDDAVAAQTRNQAAAKAFLDAHPGVRQAFDSVVVFAEAAGHNPVTTELKMSAIP